MTADTDAILARLLTDKAAARGQTSLEVRVRAEVRRGRWWAVLEIDGMPVLERGPCVNRAAADAACTSLNEAIAQSGIAEREEPSP
jgi:hypothetical protein